MVRQLNPELIFGDDAEKKYYYGIHVGTESGKVYVNPSDDAAMQHFEDLGPKYSKLEKRLNYNRGKNGEYYNTGINGMSIENALTLTTVGNTELRYHVEHTPNGYYVNLYGINTSTGEYAAIPIKGSNETQRFAGTSEYELNQMLTFLKTK